ncbi:MAG: hypothetical protein NVSMB27_12440 [Ktedonobacteraceae bacterium]
MDDYRPSGLSIYKHSAFVNKHVNGIWIFFSHGFSNFLVYMQCTALIEVVAHVLFYSPLAASVDERKLTPKNDQIDAGVTAVF